jgi:hypothetical protein
MKKVFTHENRMIVYNMKNMLEAEGIEIVIKNEYSGGGVGDLPAFDTWPELWIRKEVQLAQAESILQSVASPAVADDWFCGVCREKNDAVFCICWNCGRSVE